MGVTERKRLDRAPTSIRDKSQESIPNEVNKEILSNAQNPVNKPVSQDAGPSQSQIPRPGRSVLSEVPIEHEKVNSLLEGDDSNKNDSEILNATSSDLKRKRSEDTSDNSDDGNELPRSPKKKISIQEKLKAFKAPPLT